MESSMMKIATIALTAYLFGSAALADTLTVGPAGSGADFEKIADAIASAAPGDTVLVYPGNYESTAVLLIEKSLTLIGFGSDVTTYTTVPSFPLSATLPLLVRNLGPGEEVRVAGLRLASKASVISSGPAIAVLSDCAGPVTLADVAGYGTPGGLGISGVVFVQRCDQVLLDGCSFASFPATQDAFLVQPGLGVVESTVHVNACAIAGAAGIALGSGPVADGAPGIHAVDSLVRLSRSKVLGGNGGGSILLLVSPLASDGGPALAGSGSTYYVRGGGDDELRGGKGGVGSASGTPVYGFGSAAIALSSDSLASTTPDVALAPGPDGDGQVTAPPVDPSGTWAQLPERLATLAGAPSVVPLGGATTVALGGEPGSLWFPFFSFAQAPALAIPGIAGVVVLPLGGYAALPAVVLDGAGAGSFPVPIPTTPVLAGLSVLVQGLALSPSGAPSISSPSLVAIAQ
jgi:hypothetical protein